MCVLVLRAKEDGDVVAGRRREGRGKGIGVCVTVGERKGLAIYTAYCFSLKGKGKGTSL